MQTQKLNVIKSSLETARSWEAKGNDWRNTAWSNKCITTALMNLLSVAVEQFSNQLDAATWLLKNSAIALLHRAHEQLEQLIAGVDAGRVPPSALGGNYPHLVYAHFSWALRAFSLGEAFVAISERKDNLQISTQFWSEYAKAMGCLVGRQLYSVPKMKLRGQEEYWTSYLHLIAGVAGGESKQEALQRIENAFVKRNSDKRIKDDAYEVEGSGIHPVQWDYRRDSLLEYIRNAEL